MAKRIITVLTVVGLLGGMMGGFYTWNQGLARASDVLVLRAELQAIQRLFKEDQNLRRARDIESRLWVLEQRYEKIKMPISVKEEVHRLQVELKELRRK